MLVLGAMYGGVARRQRRTRPAGARQEPARQTTSKTTYLLRILISDLSAGFKVHGGVGVGVGVGDNASQHLTDLSVGRVHGGIRKGGTGGTGGTGGRRGIDPAIVSCKEYMYIYLKAIQIVSPSNSPKVGVGVNTTIC